MIDHVTVHCSDVKQSRAFFEKALAPLGYGVIMEFGEHCGLGVGGKPDLWLGPGTPPASHLAFRAANRAAVDAFHAAALAAGGTDNGTPGLRPEYHPTYYGAFVIDRDGNNIEAVTHAPE